MLFSIVSLVLMTADHRTHYLDVVRGELLMVIYPLQLAVDLPIKAASWVAESISFRKTLVRENEGLRRDRLLLSARLAKFADLEAENNRLRGLLDSSVKIADRVLIAEVLAVDLDPFSRRLVINKGTGDGVVVGQSLIDSNGIMGQVVSAGPVSSNALLITDPSHALPVQLNRNGLRTVAVGTGSLSLLSLSHIPNNSDVRIGDLVVTSGLGGRFPSGYPVGRVVSIERDRSQAFAQVMIKPSAHLERNREVLLVWSSSEAEVVQSAMPNRGAPKW
jgi:rod shape-determining protein MreC